MGNFRTGFRKQAKEVLRRSVDDVFIAQATQMRDLFGDMPHVARLVDLAAIWNRRAGGGRVPDADRPDADTVEISRKAPCLAANQRLDADPRGRLPRRSRDRLPCGGPMVKANVRTCSLAGFQPILLRAGLPCAGGRGVNPTVRAAKGGGHCANPTTVRKHFPSSLRTHSMARALSPSLRS